MIIILKKLTIINFKEGKLDFLLKVKEIEKEVLKWAN